MARSPRRPTPRQRIEALLEQFAPPIREAFMEAVQDIAKQAEVARIAERLERGDIDGAIRALHLDPAAYRTLDEAIRQAYIGGGSSAVAGMPVLREPDGGRVVLRFDARNPRAEQWLTEHSSTLITRIVDDQRAAVRQALTEGMVDGRNPRSVALDIVGRVNRATGRREGGIIGLTAQQERFVASARRELSDPAIMEHYFTRKRRDRSFDGMVLKAIREEKPLDRATIDRIVGRYSDRLLELRGETIARTEAMASLHASQMEAYRQAIDTGAVARQDVRRVWVSTRDNRVRDSHRAMDGESVGLDEAYSNGLMYPGDPNGPVSETANCRCTQLIRIDFMSNLA